MTSRYDWETIRAEYEAGATMGELSRRHGVTKAAISQRAKREAWVQNLTEAVNRLTEAKLNGLAASQEGSSAMYFVARTGTGGWSPGYNLTFSGSMERLTAKVKVTIRAMSAGREARVKKDANLSIVSSGYLAGKDSPPYPVRPGLIMDGKIGINGKNIGPFFKVVNLRLADKEAANG